MAHNDYVMPAGKWVSIASPQMIARLDGNVAEGINGDDGGTWNPIAPIAIGGAGFQSNSSACTLVGGVRTGRGYAANSPTPPRIALSGSKFPIYDAPRERVILVSPGVLGDRPTGGDGLRYDRSGNVVQTGVMDHVFHLPQLRFHSGATLTKIVFRWTLLQRPLAMPPLGSDEIMTVRGYRLDLAGYPSSAVEIDLHSDTAVPPVGGVYYSGGWGTVNYATLEDKWNGGRVKSLEYVPNQNNVIDTNVYTYQARIIIGYPALVHPIELTFSNIVDHRFE